MSIIGVPSSTSRPLSFKEKPLRESKRTIVNPTGLGLSGHLAALAEFELELIRERVGAGMDRAARQVRKIGRLRVTRIGGALRPAIKQFWSASGQGKCPGDGLPKSWVSVTLH